MTLFRFLLAGAATLSLVNTAQAQESLLERINPWGKKEEPAPKTVQPPDATTSYFGNKTADLPAQKGDWSDIAGAWTITTERGSSSCSLDGHAHIQVTASGEYTCDLVIRDYCEDRHDGIIRQSCTLQPSGGGIFVAATVLESLNGATLYGYSPDDFLLYSQEDGTLVGNHEGYGGYPAVWRRTLDGIS